MSRGPYAALPETMASCACCSSSVERRTAALSEAGEPLCADCAMRGEIAINEAGSALYMKGAAYGNLAFAGLGVLYNPFFLVSFALILNGTTVARQLVVDDSWYRRRLGGHYWPALICVIAGAVIGGLLVLLPMAGVASAVYG